MPLPGSPRASQILHAQAAWRGHASVRGSSRASGAELVLTDTAFADTHAKSLRGLLDRRANPPPAHPP
jgi:hypothetical protein